MAQDDNMKQSNTSVQKGNYTAENIQILEGLEAVRKRPAMYIGDVDNKGLHHLVNEVIDNSIDEAVAGYCDKIDMTIHEDNSITIQDNGRGIPTETHKDEDRSALEVVMTLLHAGGKFSKDTYKVSGGLHGVGVSCVNALSTYFKAQVHRNGKIWVQEYEEGRPQYEVKTVGETDETGTVITFKPDASIFKVTTFNFETLASRLKELAYLNKGLTLTITDEREEDDNGNQLYEEFHSEEGLRGFVKYLDETRDSLLPEPIHVEQERDDIVIEIAMQYNDGHNENVHSYVNNINTLEGGTHISGFKRAITRTFKRYGKKEGSFKNLKFDVTGDDFREGLTAVVSVQVPEPQFEGQTKTKLGNSEVTGAVEKVLGDALRHYLEENPKEAKRIMKKVELAASARNAAKKARELVQRKGALVSTNLPGKLSDCTVTDPEKAELFLVEGDSAGGTAKQGRDRKFQAILPLRGKILNVEKAMEHKIYENDEIKNIFTALGVTFGDEEDEKAINLDNLRYRKVIIMTDADVDGSHITTLIMTFIFRYMKELIELGYLYVATPPLYLVKQGKTEEYCWTEDERESLVKELQNNDKKTKVTVQRYKGLGEMSAEQLWETTMNPNSRTLQQVSIESAAEADRIFSVLMGDDVPPRREFIENHAKYANLDV